jgi:hypothetical protein
MTNYILSTTTYHDFWKLKYFKRLEIHELAHIHNVEINIYDLDGRLLKSSKGIFYE